MTSKREAFMKWCNEQKIFLHTNMASEIFNWFEGHDAIAYSKPSTINYPSDEEISRLAGYYTGSNAASDNTPMEVIENFKIMDRMFIKGARWMRDKMAGTSNKLEIIPPELEYKLRNANISTDILNTLSRCELYQSILGYAELMRHWSDLAYGLGYKYETCTKDDEIKKPPTHSY